MQKRAAGGELTAQESALLRRVFTGGGGRRSGGGGGRRAGAFGGRYIVFALRGGTPAPVEIETGLTDLDHMEVVSGLAEGDTVLVLPSASLVNAQKEMRDRMQQRSGLPGVQRTTGGTVGSAGAAGGSASDRRSQGR
jgi:hypothetical protein